ncbi:MAG TPA: ELWxxDGT repeat protein, partial [Thermoanaerobaculia bacterium]|nr:ELWxxDGT repeat protein [Thermoanaerobaculia bacterium]
SSDATPAGTSMIADLAPNVAPSSQPLIRGAAGNRVLFDATDNSGTTSPWVSDGTAQGTIPFPTMVKTSLRYHGRLYFDDGNYGVRRTDGTAEGTTLLSTSAPSSASFGIGGDVLYIAQGNTLYAVNGDSDAVKIGDGTFSTNIDAMGDLVYLSPYFHRGDDFLYAISGVSAPRPLRLFTQTLYSPFFTAGGFLCYFAADNGATQLWCTDGTASLVSIAAFPGYTLPSVFGNAGERVVFAINDGLHGKEPWGTDGTSKGTMLLADINGGPASTSFGPAVSLGDRVIFAADDGTSGLEPWVSDGTPGGTHLVLDIAPGKESSMQSEMVAMKGNAYFAATDLVHGNELWRSDGTAGGTQLAGDLEPGSRSSYPSQLTAADDLLYFTAQTIANGRELWALPVPGRTISIGDGHAGESAASAQLPVTLDAPSSEVVSAQWTALGESHPIAFQPGETRKTISIPIAAGGGARTIPVRLDQVRGANPVRRSATVVVQENPGPADLSMAISSTWKNGENVAYITVTNHGPSAVPWVQLTFNGVPSPPAKALLAPLRPGESVSTSFRSIGLYAATASSATIDPDLSNNSVNFRADFDSYRTLALTVSPAEVSAGMHATLSISSMNDGVVRLTSSNPSVFAVPESVQAPAELDLVALSEGTTVITAVNAYGHTNGMLLSAGPPGASRWPSELQFAIEDAALYYGTPRRFTARVAGASTDGTRPGGSVAFLDGGQVLATVPLDANGNAGAIINTLLPGDHLISARYSGDANFSPANSAASVPLHIHPPAPVTFAGSARPVSATEDEVTIVVVVPAGSPGGTMTLTDLAKNALAVSIPVVAGRAVATIPRTEFVTVHYSGDDLFAPSVVNIPLAPAHRHAARP